MIRNCRKLINYKARTKNGKKYLRRGFYCKTCGKQINESTYEVFNGECWNCNVKGF